MYIFVVVQERERYYSDGPSSAWRAVGIAASRPCATRTGPCMERNSIRKPMRRPSFTAAHCWRILGRSSRISGATGDIAERTQATDTEPRLEE